VDIPLPTGAETMRKAIITSIAIAANVVIAQVPAWAEQTTADKDGCIVDVQKEGGETTKICKDRVTFGGEIKDVTWRTPLGGGNATIPKAGKDAEKLIHNFGKAVGGLF
jgi:hypothetical protein